MTINIYHKRRIINRSAGDLLRSTKAVRGDEGQRIQEMKGLQRASGRIALAAAVSIAALGAFGPARARAQDPERRTAFVVEARQGYFQEHRDAFPGAVPGGTSLAVSADRQNNIPAFYIPPALKNGAPRSPIRNLANEAVSDAKTDVGIAKEAIDDVRLRKWHKLGDIESKVHPQALGMFLEIAAGAGVLLGLRWMLRKSLLKVEPQFAKVTNNVNIIWEWPFRKVYKRRFGNEPRSPAYRRGDPLLTGKRIKHYHDDGEPWFLARRMLMKGQEI
ncbi:MAG: hypothetical protein M1321_00490 [Candidatus Marsarchaeota archaeon]|nr:hypothetical protein [Candidatus Marsarchaeota archaeon]